MDYYKEFNKQYGLTKKPLNHDTALKTAYLIADELQEFLAEFFPDATVDVNMGGEYKESPDHHNAAKELTDIRYITGQQMAEYGMDVTALDAEVHRSNMSKSIDDFDMAAAELQTASVRYPEATINQTSMDDVYVIKCLETGKVIKPTTYSQAVITDAMIGKE